MMTTSHSFETNFAADHRLANIRILFVDDDECIRDSMGFFMTSLGATVDFASTGPEAVGKAVGGDYQIVLMDFNLPGLDGDSCLRALRNSGFSTPVIAISAHSADALRTKCLDAGFNDYLAKPFDLNAVVQTILHHLMKNSPQQRLH